MDRGGLANTNDHGWAAVGYGNLNASGATGLADTTQYYLSNSQNVMGVVNEGNSFRSGG